MAIVPLFRARDHADLPSVPPLVQYLVLRFFPPILAWIAARLMHLVLARCADHPLVQLARTYNPSAVVAACAAFHHPHGTKGAPPTFSIDCLVRAEIVRAWANTCSDRDLEWHLASNLLARHFVGLALFDPTPDHATLSRFHAFVAQHAPDALFQDVLTFLDRVDPEDATATPQIIDTFGMAAPAAWPPHVATLLLDLCADLCVAWLQHAPPSSRCALPPLDLGPILHPLRPRDALERTRLLVQAVSLAQYLLYTLSPHLLTIPHPQRTTIQELLSALAKVLSDEVTLDATGYPTERTTKGTYRIISATDLHATFRKHDDDLLLGYNVAIATTATRIRGVVVTTGATPDSETPERLLRQYRATDQPLPPAFVMDRAGGWGKVRARVDVLSGTVTQMVARIPTAGGVDGHHFSPADFVVDAERTQCTCPNGVTSRDVTRYEERGGVQFRFLASQCRACPLWEQCRQPTTKRSSHRIVFISEYQMYLRQAAAFNQTAAGRALLGQRWMVEPTIAWLVRYQGCRRARRVGLAAAACQVWQAAAVRNLLLWLSRRARGMAAVPLGTEVRRAA